MTNEAQAIIPTKDELIGYIWDVYKEINGVRPRFLPLSSMTWEELESYARRLAEQAEEYWQEENNEEMLRGMEQCFALHHPHGRIHLSEWGEEELVHCHNNDLVAALRAWDFSRYYVEGTSIHIPVAPKVTLGDLFDLRRMAA